jgi:hypothetical protein
MNYLSLNPWPLSQASIFQEKQTNKQGICKILNILFCDKDKKTNLIHEYILLYYCHVFRQSSMLYCFPAKCKPEIESLTSHGMHKYKQISC